MVNPNTITQGAPELRDILLGFLESASSLCDTMSTTMAAALNEIVSIQADEACGAAYGERSDATYVGCRVCGRVCREAFVTAIGAGDDDVRRGRVLCLKNTFLRSEVVRRFLGCTTSDLRKRCVLG